MKVSLESARKNAGLTQQDISDRISKSINTICDWEKGRKEISEDDLSKYCDACNCTIDDLDVSVARTIRYFRIAGI